MCPSYRLGHLLDICPGEVLLDPPVVLCPIFWGTARLISRVVDTHGRNYRDKVWSWDERMDHLETAISRDPPHNQLPNTDTIAYTSKILSKGPRCSCLLWGYAGAWQTQKWVLTVSYWMEHRAPNGGARESTQGAKGICNPIGGTKIWTNQNPQSSCL